MNHIQSRRDALVSESARQRDALRRHLEGLQPAARVADRAMGIARFVKQRPMLMTMLSLALTFSSRRHRWLRRLGGTALLWRVLRAVAFK